jgi:hypothetical protein
MFPNSAQVSQNPFDYSRPKSSRMPNAPTQSHVDDPTAGGDAAANRDELCGRDVHCDADRHGPQPAPGAAQVGRLQVAGPRMVRVEGKVRQRYAY